MLVDESLDHLQVTTGTLKGERSVSSLIHCNCGYKQISGVARILGRAGLKLFEQGQILTP